MYCRGEYISLFAPFDYTDVPDGALDPAPAPAPAPAGLPVVLRILLAAARRCLRDRADSRRREDWPGVVCVLPSLRSSSAREHSPAFANVRRKDAPHRWQQQKRETPCERA